MNGCRPKSMRLGVWACLLLAGCAGYGSIRRVPTEARLATIGELSRRADEYRIYRAGVGLDHPSGVLFIPRDGGYAVELGRMWREVATQEDLLRILEGLRHPVDWPFYEVELYRVLTADDQPIGYLYTGWNHLTVKQRADATVRISDLPDPPQFLGDDAERNAIW